MHHVRRAPTGQGRIRPTRIAGASLALALIGAGIGLPQAAIADPATLPAATTITTVGAFSGTVPAGACFLDASVLGGAGGKAQAIANSNGAGARIDATFAVTPGETYSGTVAGGGGSVQTPGVNGGGSGGISTTSTHPGAGGGGYSDLLLDSTLAILAGGGGGSSGGHTASTEGFGGDGGLPGAAGGLASGTAGTAGRDNPQSIVVGGGAGGTDTAPGAGGAHSTAPERDGTAGVGRTGGNGGADDNADTGGGGGGGYFGGGGGASTVDQGVGGSITGGGGGGGSSFVDPSATDISAVVGPKLVGSAQGPGAAGSVTLTWVGCDYDLAVTKTASTASTTIGQTLAWTVSVANMGPAAMTQGDTVTITDSLPGSGTKTITDISTTGGTNTALERAPISCDAEVGDAMPATLECSRPYQPVGGAIVGTRGLDVGEVLTITYQQTAVGAVNSVLQNTAAVTDRTPGDANDSATASSTLVADPPVARDDADLDNALGSTVSVNVLGNDSGTIVPNSVTLYDPTTSAAITSPLVVSGEGTWTVSTGGIITFAPEVGFTGNPAPVTYQVTDANGLTDLAEVTVTYLPEAADDTSAGNAVGTPVTVDVVGNDTGVFDPTSVVLIDPANGNRVTRLVVAGEGTWTVNAVTGAITFTPLSTFTGDPTPVTYEVTNLAGDVTSAAITITYVHPAAGLASTGADVVVPLIVAIAMLLAGLGAILVGRRRNQANRTL